MRIVEWVKEHPYETGMIVFGSGAALFILYDVIKGGSSSTQNSTSQNQTAFDNAALQTEQQAAQENMALQEAQLSSQTQIALANIKAGSINNQTNTQGQTAQLATVAGLQATENTNSTNAEENAVNQAAAIENTLANDQAALGETQLNTQEQIAVTQSANQTTQQLAAINAQTQQVQAEQVAGAEKAIAKDQETSGMFGSALSFLGNIF